MTRRALFGNLTLSLFSFLILATAFFLTPNPKGFGTHEKLHLPPCLFRALTHLPCPSCGLTTSFAYFAKGAFLKSFQANLMGPFLFLGVLGLGCYALFFIYQQKEV